MKDMESDFNLTIEGETANLNMEITSYVEQSMKGDPLYLELEMLQGKREGLPNGMIKYEITITHPLKQLLVREFVLIGISMSQGGYSVN